METRILFTWFLLFVVIGGSAQWQSNYEHKSFTLNQDTLNYRVMYPLGFSENSSYPVVLFLHGAGERGNANQKQLVHGGSLFSEPQNRQNYPAIVIFPQCPTDSFWSNASIDRSKKGRGKLMFRNGGEPTKSMHLVVKLMDSIVKKSFVKDDQVYVIGLSMGGMGTFEILSRRPQMFAGAIPICGGGNVEAAAAYAKGVPLWVVHGAKDDVVDPDFSLEMVRGILAAGGHPRFTLYDDANHNSWDSIFSEPDFMSWLFTKKRD